jgi:hypothetical protein
MVQKWREENLNETFSKLASTSRETSPNTADKHALSPELVGGDSAGRNEAPSLLDCGRRVGRFVLEVGSGW